MILSVLVKALLTRLYLNGHISLITVWFLLEPYEKKSVLKFLFTNFQFMKNLSVSNIGHNKEICLLCLLLFVYNWVLVWTNNLMTFMPLPLITLCLKWIILDFFLKMSAFLACSRGGLSETNLLSSDDDVDGSKKNAEAICNEHYKHKRRSTTRVFPRFHTRGKRSLILLINALTRLSWARP